MEATAHGDFTIVQNGEIFLITFFGTWNIEGVRAFFLVYRETLARAQIKRFGVISDMTHAEGGTPEAIEHFNDIANWASQVGQVARALVIDSDFKRYIVKLIDKRGRQFPVESFSNTRAAIQWLKTFGLSVDDDV